MNAQEIYKVINDKLGAFTVSKEAENVARNHWERKHEPTILHQLKLLTHPSATPLKNCFMHENTLTPLYFNDEFVAAMRVYRQGTNIITYNFEDGDLEDISAIKLLPNTNSMRLYAADIDKTDGIVIPTTPILSLEFDFDKGIDGLVNAIGTGEYKEEILEAAPMLAELGFISIKQ